MKKKTNLYFIILLTGLLTSQLSHAGMITPVNLNDFFADPTAVVSAGGGSATLSEDPSLFSVLLSNDPFFGDPNIIIPGANTFLTFDYDFTEAMSEDDEFGAFIIDVSTGSSAGMPFEFFVDNTASGSVSFDLSSLVGLTLGLQFELNSLFADTGFDSSVDVSNVQLEIVPPPSAVPLPSAIFLFIPSLIGLTAIRRKKG